MLPDDLTPRWDLLDHRDAGQVLSDWLDAHPEVDKWLPVAGQELLERRSGEMLKLTYEERTRQPRQVRHRRKR